VEAVRGIGFDLDHTLAIDNRLERVAFLRLLEVVLSQGGRTVGTFGDEIDAIDALLQRQRQSDLTIDEAVGLFVSEHGVQPDEVFVESFRAMAVNMIDEFVVPLPGVRETIGTLRERGIAVAVLTNGWNPLQKGKAAKAGFDGPVLVSSEIGVRKPSAGAFRRLTNVLGSEPENTLYVGDDPYSDVAGARAAGLQTVWMNWERQEYPPSLAPPGYTVRSFAELLALVPECVRAS
jgi:HAD superfamily hydrolase (TIGR01509 family)